MNIKSFEAAFSTTILQRGRDYFRRGNVGELFEKTTMNWQAEVEGTYVYIVTIKLRENGEVIRSHCNCPYDWGNYCKHEAAVFYALQKAFNFQEIKEEKKETTLKKLLQTRSKEELIELILDSPSTNSRIYNQLIGELNQPEKVIDSAEKLILYHIEKTSSNGLAPSIEVSKVLEGVNLTLEQVKEKMEISQFKLSIDLSLICLKHAVGVLKFSNVTSMDVIGVIEHCLKFIEQATKKGVTTWNYEKKKTINSKIIEEAMDEQFDDWADWRFELLTTCIHICKDIRLQNQLNTVLEALLEQVRSDSWDDKYKNGKLKEIQFKLILQSEDTKEIERFLLDNLSGSIIREKAILYSLEKIEFQQALQLKIETL